MPRMEQISKVCGTVLAMIVGTLVLLAILEYLLQALP